MGLFRTNEWRFPLLCLIFRLVGMCIQNVMIMSFCTIMNPTDELIFLMHGENWCRSRLHGVVRCVKKIAQIR